MDPSFSMLVFSLVLDSRKSSGRGRSLYQGPRFNMCVCMCVCRARVSSAKSRYVLVFDARHTFFVTDPRQFGPFLRFLPLFSPLLLSIASFSQSDHFLLSFSPLSPSFFFFTLFFCSQISQIIKSWSNSRTFLSLRSSSRFSLHDIEFQRIFPSIFFPRFLCFWIRKRKFHYTLTRTVCTDLSLVHICFFASFPPKFSLVFFSSRLKFEFRWKSREKDETSMFVGLLPEIPVVSQFPLSDYPFSLAIWTCLEN